MQSLLFSICRDQQVWAADLASVISLTGCYGFVVAVAMDVCICYMYRLTAEIGNCYSSFNIIWLLLQHSHSCYSACGFVVVVLVTAAVVIVMHAFFCWVAVEDHGIVQQNSLCWQDKLSALMLTVRLLLLLCYLNGIVVAAAAVVVVHLSSFT